MNCFRSILVLEFFKNTIFETFEKHQSYLYCRFDQSFDVVKQVFSAFNLYSRVFYLLNQTTGFKAAAMTHKDFDNINFGQVCKHK